MISRLKGTLIFHTDKFIVLDVHGVGYKVFVSPDTLFKMQTQIGQEFSLWTHLAVREDALDLFGFFELGELEFFTMLINVSGIGPKSALGIIGTASLSTLRQAIGSGDTSYLTKVSGIGKKTAEKIVIELRDKLAKEGHSNENGALKDESDVLEALKSLGYREGEARDALKQLSPDTLGASARIKEALKILGGKKN